MAQLPGIRHPAQITFNFKTRRAMGKDFHMQYTNYDFLTVSEAADLLETKDTYVYTLIRKGLLVTCSEVAAAQTELSQHCRLCADDAFPAASISHWKAYQHDPASRQTAPRTFTGSWFYPRYGERNSCSPPLIYDR